MDDDYDTGLVHRAAPCRWPRAGRPRWGCCRSHRSSLARTSSPGAASASAHAGHTFGAQVGALILIRRHQVVGVVDRQQQFALGRHLHGRDTVLARQGAASGHQHVWGQGAMGHAQVDLGQLGATARTRREAPVHSTKPMQAGCACRLHAAAGAFPARAIVQLWGRRRFCWSKGGLRPASRAPSCAP